MIESHTTRLGNTFTTEVIEPVGGKRILLIPVGVTVMELYEIIGKVPGSGRKIITPIRIEIEWCPND